MNITQTYPKSHRLLKALMVGLLSLMGMNSSIYAATQEAPSPPSTHQKENNRHCSPLLSVKKRLLASESEKSLCDYQGKVILVVNTASKCGFTPQYEGLEKLYAEYEKKGLVVLGFPSNDFMGQEPGTEKEIKSFCRLTYGVKFPMFEKTEVKRGTKDPFYSKLAKAADNTYPKWNFYKYLIDRDGQFVDVYSSMTDPYDEDLIERIQGLLDKKKAN